MSRLKISENLFLEKNELVRQQEFITTAGWQRALQSVVKKFGIVQNQDNTSFGVVSSATPGAVDVLPGLAYNTAMEAIVSDRRVTLLLGAAVSGESKWIVLSRSITNEEQGTVSVQTDGSLTGVGTEFTKVLRGQPNFPTKVRFVSSNQNVYEYEVVSVTSDTSAVLSGNFVAESGMKYAVVGTFTPGYVPSEGDKNIYEYDSFELRVENSGSRPEITADEFILAQIKYGTGGAWSIVDLRGDYLFSTESSNSPTETEEGSNGNNPLVSLLGVMRIGGTAYGDMFTRIEFLIEYAYRIISFDYVSSGSGYVLTISNGSCNALALAPSAIPDGLFNGFLVLNRDNMRSVKVLSQTGNTLLIENKEDASQLLSENSDLIIVPDFSHIEFSIIAGSNVVMPEIPFTKETGAAGGRLRMTIDLQCSGRGGDYGNIKLKLKYRMFSSSGHLGRPFAFNTASYRDYTDGVNKSVTDGEMTLGPASTVPVTEERNYS